jgi:hypothetical protein
MYSQNLKSTKKLEQISINWQNSGHESILDTRKVKESLSSFQINRVIDVLDVEAFSTWISGSSISLQ